jgi:hypothetical protein
MEKGPHTLAWERSDHRATAWCETLGTTDPTDPRRISTRGFIQLIGNLHLTSKSFDVLIVRCL